MPRRGFCAISEGSPKSDSWSLRQRAKALWDALQEAATGWRTWTICRACGRALSTIGACARLPGRSFARFTPAAHVRCRLTASQLRALTLDRGSSRELCSGFVRAGLRPPALAPLCFFRPAVGVPLTKGNLVLPLPRPLMLASGEAGAGP